MVHIYSFQNYIIVYRLNFNFNTKIVLIQSTLDIWYNNLHHCSLQKINDSFQGSAVIPFNFQIAILILRTTATKEKLQTFSSITQEASDVSPRKVKWYTLIFDARFNWLSRELFVRYNLEISLQDYQEYKIKTPTLTQYSF